MKIIAENLTTRRSLENAFVGGDIVLKNVALENIAMQNIAMQRIVLSIVALLSAFGYLAVPEAYGQQVVTRFAADHATIDYYRPRVAAAADGSYAVAWEELVEGQFSTEWKIAVQRYDPIGTAVGPLNYFDPESGCLAFDSWLSDGQQNTELTFDTSGQLLVVMEHFGELIIFSDGRQSSEITLGVVDQNGSIVDQSNSSNCVQWKFIFPGADEQDRARMVMLPGGLAMIMDGFFGGTNFRNIGLQFFDLALSTVGDIVVPHDDENSLEGFHSYADIATNGSILVVTWHECPFIDSQGNTSECDAVAQFAQLNAGSLTAIGGNIRASSGDPTGTWSTRPSVAMSPQGNSVIVWQDTRNRLGGDVFGQRFDAAGQAIGSNFQISQDGTSLEFWPGVRPEVAMRNDGSFMVVWSDSLNGTWRAFGRQYNAAGEVLGPPTPLASETGADFVMPAVATDGTNYYYTGIGRTSTGSLELFVNAPHGNVAVEDRDEQSVDLTLDAYPNPFRDAATVKTYLPQAAHLTIEVADLVGRIVYRNDRGLLAPGLHKLELDTSMWPSGPYLLRITAAGQFASSLLTKPD